MAEEKKSLQTPRARVGGYPKFFTKGLPNDAGVAYYEADLLISPDEQKTPAYTALKAAAAAAAKDEFKGDLPENFRSPFRKASSKKRQNDNSPYYPEADFPGYILLHVKSKNMPGIVGTKIDPETGKLQKIVDDIEVYGGCYVRVSVHPFAYQVKGNAGVSFWMNNVQKLGEGESLGGRGAAAEDEFGPVAGASDEELDNMFGEAA